MSTWIYGLLGLSLMSADAEVDVSVTLDEFHHAASTADGERYFGSFAPGAVFLGTDANERWSVDEFRAYAEPYFSKGIGWTYVASDRHIEFGAEGRVAWFDERLQNEKYGEVRGSGVLTLADGAWKIAQYNLSFPVPNEHAEGVVKKSIKQESSGYPRAEQFFAVDGERQLAIWNKVVPATLEAPAEQRETVVLLPSATFSARATWDFPLGDYSVMNDLARRGMDVFAVDVGGYGLSSPAIDEPSGGAQSAVRDLLVALDKIAELRGARQVVLVGPSWGSQVAALFAKRHPERVKSLVLYGFNWSQRYPEEVIRDAYGDQVLEQAHREVTVASASGDFVPGYYEEGVPEAFATHLLSQGRSVPTGALRDYCRNLPVVQPAELSMPTLMIFGRLEFEFPDPEQEGEWVVNEAHRSDCREFFAGLPAHRHWLEIPGAGHSAHLDNGNLLFKRCLAGWILRE